MFNLLDKSLGKIGDLIWNKMGDKFYELSGNDLMKEANMMCLKLMCVGPMKPSESAKLIRGRWQKSSIVRQGVKASRLIKSAFTLKAWERAEG